MNNEDRRLIFSNMLNGVPVQDIARAFQSTEVEVQRVYDSVIMKIKISRFKSQMPYIKLDDLADAKTHKIELLDMAQKLEPVLGNAPTLKIRNQEFKVIK